MTAGKRTQVAERVAGSGYLSQDDGRVHFGLPIRRRLSDLKIAWPSGTVQNCENVKADRVLLVEEPK